MERQPGPSLHSRAAEIRFFVLTAVGLIAFFIIRLLYVGVYHSPPNDADEIYFDVLAVNLAAGHGLSGAVTPEVEAAFAGLSPAVLGALNWTQRLGGDDLTAFRPPLFPAMLAGMYSIFGHSFVAFRTLNCVLLALGVAVLASLVRAAGASRLWWVPVVAGMLDPHLLVLSRSGLSEPLAFALTAVLLWFCVVHRQGSRAQCFGAGITSGLLVLARPVFLFWLPGVLWAVFRRQTEHERLPPRLKRSLLTCLVAASVYAPWGVRNMLLLERPLPFGSQGGLVLGSIYLNPPPDWDGNWTIDAWNEFLAAIPTHEHGIVQERAATEFGEAITSAWLRSHTAELPRLWLRRAESLWWVDAMPYQRVLVMVSLAAGTILLFAADRVRPLLFFAVLQTAGVALTYNARADDTLYGRYLLSVYPVLYVAITVAVWRTVRAAFIPSPAGEGH